MYRKIVANLLILAFAVSLALATEVNNCRGGEPQPVHVDIIGCDAQPCLLPRGQDVVMIMNFTAGTDPIEEFRTSVMAQPEATEGWVPFPMPSNACEDLINTHCPLEANEPAAFRLEMPILRVYPRIGLLLEFSIKQNGGDGNLVCFAVNCRVT